jgi:hypothetical protein
LAVAQCQSTNGTCVLCIQFQHPLEHGRRILLATSGAILFALLAVLVRIQRMLDTLIEQLKNVFAHEDSASHYNWKALIGFYDGYIASARKSPISSESRFFLNF